MKHIQTQCAVGRRTAGGGNRPGLGGEGRGDRRGLNFTTLDPYDANDTLSQAVAKSFYQGLFGFDKDMKLVNVLADSYEVSKDGLTYTVKLRQGLNSTTAPRSTPRR